MIHNKCKGRKSPKNDGISPQKSQELKEGLRETPKLAKPQEIMRSNSKDLGLSSTLLLLPERTETCEHSLIYFCGDMICAKNCGHWEELK